MIVLHFWERLYRNPLSLFGSVIAKYVVHDSGQFVVCQKRHIHGSRSSGLLQFCRYEFPSAPEDFLICNVHSVAGWINWWLKISLKYPVQRYNIS